MVEANNSGIPQVPSVTATQLRVAKYHVVEPHSSGWPSTMWWSHTIQGCQVSSGKATQFRVAKSQVVEANNLGIPQVPSVTANQLRVTKYHVVEPHNSGWPSTMWWSHTIQGCHVPRSTATDFRVAKNKGVTITGFIVSLSQSSQTIQSCQVPSVVQIIV